MPPQKGRSHLVDQLKLLVGLMRRRDPVTVKELAAERIEGDPWEPPDDETVRRHLVRMQEHGTGVTVEGRYNGAWRFVWPHDAAVEPVGLLALRIAHTLLASMRGSRIGNAFQDLLDDHDRRTPPSEFKAPDVSRMFIAKSRMLNPLGVVPARLDVLAEAIFNRREVRITYMAFDKPAEERVIEPYSLVFADEGIYLYCRRVDGRDADFQRSLRLYNVVRVTSITPTGAMFQYPPADQYNPERDFRHCFGIFLGKDPTAPPVEVVVDFAPRWWGYLTAQKWHRDQSDPERTADGWCRVRFQLHLTHDLRTWLRGLGDEVRVVAPAELVDEVRRGVLPS